MEGINLNLVTNKIAEQNYNLYLDENSNLTYKGQDGSEIKVTNKSSLDRPVYSSELTDKLKNRRWNLPIRKYIVDNQDGVNLYTVNDNLENYVEPEMDFTNNVYEVSNNQRGWTIQGQPENYERLKYMFNTNTEIMEKRNILDNTITVYNSSKIIVDLLSNSISFNMIDSDLYTDTLNLSGIKKKLPEVNATITLNVEYSIYGELYQDNAEFSLDGDMIINPDSKYVSIELIDNILRIFPKSNKVGECIIKNCFVTYENN